MGLIQNLTGIYEQSCIEYEQGRAETFRVIERFGADGGAGHSCFAAADGGGGVPGAVYGKIQALAGHFDDRHFCRISGRFDRKTHVKILYAIQKRPAEQPVFLCVK